ncbi:MAG: gfo/Idh/MocA family oxidoreductase [Sulfobacillus acidophilus]|uniref:Gfo/Idh/MocA family oxidoreductase n=1 Tax=Sulfobacillus acidophilus TaxID=53633 RepID=A0A2T2WD70_9FIRM|nr:MAG: gfo/Idh/MocA family oxidoreductase [Sulfobacillus acidophilus]
MVIAGTGYRAVTLFGRMLTDPRARGLAQLVGLYDPNPLRLQVAASAMKVQVPQYTDFAEMLQKTRCGTVIVTTVDRTHDAYIIAALEAGKDVITEKPLTTDPEKLSRILQAERLSGHQVTVTFNYRYAPYATAVREFLASGRLGTVTSVNFEWYLDTVHGADYFRRWHRQVQNSGSLWVHKATHHFDLVNWWLQQDPVEVYARGARRFYGEQGRPHGERCSTCAFTKSCEFAFDWQGDPLFESLYRQAEAADGYWRDGCVFAGDVDIWDTMTASVRYSGGVFMNYALHAYMPFEGYRIAFNGTGGRLECSVIEAVTPHTIPEFTRRQALRCSPDTASAQDFRFPLRVSDQETLYFFPVFGGVEAVAMPRTLVDHGGGDERMALDLLAPDAIDRWGHRAGTRAGAYSILTGIAARESIAQNRAVALGELVDLALLQ